MIEELRALKDLTQRDQSLQMRGPPGPVGPVQFSKRQTERILEMQDHILGNQERMLAQSDEANMRLRVMTEGLKLPYPADAQVNRDRSRRGHDGEHLSRRDEEYPRERSHRRDRVGGQPTEYPYRRERVEGQPTKYPYRPERVEVQPTVTQYPQRVDGQPPERSHRHERDEGRDDSRLRRDSERNDDRHRRRDRERDRDDDRPRRERRRDSERPRREREREHEEGRPSIQGETPTVAVTPATPEPDPEPPASSYVPPPASVAHE